MRNLIKVGVGLVIVLMVIQGYNYMNLMISEKYETQLEGIVDITDEVQKDVDKRVNEINDRKSRIVKYTILLSILLAAFLIFMFRYSSSRSLE